jgi:hypothetical protein
VIFQKTTQISYCLTDEFRETLANRQRPDMAGLRAGAALGRADLLARIKPYSSGAMPITAMVAATASLTNSRRRCLK